MKPFDEQQQKLIDKYLEGRLSKSEEQDFQQQIQDTGFEAEVRFQEGLQDAVQFLAKEEHPLKKLFQGEEKKIKEENIEPVPRLPAFSRNKLPPSPKRVFIRRYMSAAAGLAVLAFITYQLWPFLIPSPGTPDGPSAATIQSLERPPQMTQITKSGANHLADSLAIDCITLFKSENQYSAALDCFQNLNRQQPTPEISYYIAQCFFKLEQYESAISAYNELLASSDLIGQQVQDQIRWNRLLAQILNQDKGYRAELKDMVQDKNFKYLREAMKLQEMLGG